ncbi:MAG: type I-E CRISPR-associated protein Cse1/CasA [FCB group bacterium]|nr:type I-E CRISPR-associated protein Cse1/CasA [FCB group bacterium]
MSKPLEQKLETGNFNLLDEKWIPVLYHNGRWDREGILTTFREADKIRHIAASNPMDRVAILRFLLALLYWCRGNPSDDVRDSSKELFPDEMFAKLEENRECFNLLGEGKRFYQDPTAQRSRTITDLIQEIPTGNNFWHFRHSTDKVNGLCPACCAVGLLRLPVFTTLGGATTPYLYAGINGAPPVYTLLFGKNLLETLKLNWIPYDNIGTPSWNQDKTISFSKAKLDLLTGLTHLPRRVWLHDADEPGVCFYCGYTTKKIINTCEFQSPGKNEDDKWEDPHVIYYYIKEKGEIIRKTFKSPDFTESGKFTMDHPWSTLCIRMIESGKIPVEDNHNKFYTAGFATKDARFVDIWEHIITLKFVVSAQQVILSYIDHWKCESNQLAKRISKTKNEIQAANTTVSSIRPHIENIVSAKVGELLAGGDEAWQKTLEEYRPMMEIIAKSLSPGFTTASVERRKQIADTIPDMKLKDKTKEKSEKKKGKDKWAQQQNTLKL